MRVLFAQPYPRDVTLGSPKLFLRLGAALSELGHDVDYVFLSDLPAPLRRQRLLPPRLRRQPPSRVGGRGDVDHVLRRDFLAVAPDEADVHRGRGLYYLLQRAGAVERAARDIDIFEAKSVPPHGHPPA